MFRHIFSVLSFSLLLLCCVPAFTVFAARPTSVTPVEANPISVLFLEKGVLMKRNVRSFDSPFLAVGSDVMVALSEAGFTENTNDDLGMLAMGHIGIEGENWVDRVTGSNGTNWRTQEISDDHDLGYSVLRSPTAVIKGNRVYVLALKKRGAGGSQDSDGWRFGVFSCRITSEKEVKMIYVSQNYSLNLNLTQELEKQGLKVFPDHDNSALLTSKGKILFSANATDREGKPGFAIMQLKDDAEQWKVSFVENPGKCRSFSLFEWKEKLVTIFSGCPRDTPYVKEYDEVNDEWKDADDTSFLPWGGMRRSRDFTPATIGNKTVLLFTKERSEAPIFGGGYNSDLFFTDGIRVFGPKRINTQAARAASARLLYTNGELFFIYQDVSKSSGKIVLARLNHEMETVKSVLNAWAESDAYLSKPCSETAPEDATADAPCVTPMPTDGLVSFLADNSGASEWYDEYHFRDADVAVGERVKNGYTFTEAGDGAKWRFDDGGAMGKGYDFAKYGLTVVATVTIHETPAKDIPLLVVGGVVDTTRSGLWYKDQQWKVRTKEGDEGSPISLETNTTYKMALVLHNNAISVYANGKSLGGPLPLSTAGTKPFDGESIYIGKYWGDVEIHMTVTNVLIYNRVLSDTELEAASQKIPTATPADPEETLELPKETKETPETSTETKETPKTVASSKETPETSRDSKETPEAPTDTTKIPTATPTDTEETPGTPTDPQEDSSEHVRMGASLLFLLGLRIFALLFSASI